MATIQKVHKFIEHLYKAPSLNIAIQDGPEAGQSVPHLHAHVIPRTKKGNVGDEMYRILDEWDADEVYKNFYERKAFVRSQDRDVVKPDNERTVRTAATMKEEADWLASEFKKYYNE